MKITHVLSRLPAFLAAAVITGFAGHWLLSASVRDDIQSREATLAELQTKIQEGRAAEQQLPRFREEARLLEEALAASAEPTGKAVLLSRLQRLAAAHDLEIRRLQPTPGVATEAALENPVLFSVRGPLADLVSLCEELSLQPWPPRLDVIRLRFLQNGAPMPWVQADLLVKGLVSRSAQTPAGGVALP